MITCVKLKIAQKKKTELIIEELKSNNLPVDSAGGRRILEIGIGGGESLGKIKDELAPGDSLIAVDIIHDFVAFAKKQHEVNAIVADITHLPFNDNFLSAINMSAVLHEVSSYGSKINGEKDFGLTAVKAALNEAKRVLLPNGLLAYRDVLPPFDGLFVEKTTIYKRASWEKFVKWFLADFIWAGPCYYKKEGFNYNKSSQGLVLNAPVGLHRELQRHYLMFRDYIRNVMNEKFGLVIHQLKWLNKIEGLKRGVVSIVNPELNFLVNEISIIKNSSKNNEAFEIDSDNLDLLYDKAIEFYFNKIENGDPDANQIKKYFEQWKEREGREYYIYTTPSEILTLTYDPSDAAGDVLFLTKQSDIRLVPRYYYNRYLRQVIDDPEFDGKLILGLRKISCSEARDLIKSTFSSDDGNNKAIDFQYVGYKLNINYGNRD